MGCSLPPALHPRSHLAPVTSSWSSRTAGAEVGADGGARGGRRARGAGAGRAPRFLCAWWAGCLVSRQGFGPCHCSRAPWAHFLFCLWWVCGTRPSAAPRPARCRVRLWMGLVTAVPSGPGGMEVGAVFLGHAWQGEDRPWHGGHCHHGMATTGSCKGWGICTPKLSVPTPQGQAHCGCILRAFWPRSLHPAMLSSFPIAASLHPWELITGFSGQCAD